jgi:His-Xaa-Ser system protein HxsD
MDQESDKALADTEAGEVERANERAVSALFSARVYDREAVTSAAYALTNECSVHVDPVEGDRWRVTLEPRGPVARKTLDVLLSKLRNEVIDQQTRLDLDRRFGLLRECIVEHAFAPVRREHSEGGDS